MAQAWASQRAFVLMGEAGIGKTRLLQDFASRVEHVVTVQARPGDGGIAYAVMARVLRALLARHGAVGDDGRRQALALVLLPELGDAAALAGAAQRLLLQRAVDATLADPPARGTHTNKATNASGSRDRGASAAAVAKQARGKLSCPAKIASRTRADSAPDQSPTLDSVLAALLKKYGTPTREQRATSVQLPIVRWAYDPQGGLITATSPLCNRCTGASDPNGGVNLTPDCGIVVQAMLVPQRSNPELVDRMQVGVVDQAGGYQMILATEQSLGQADQQRRAREISKLNLAKRFPLNKALLKRCAGAARAK